MGTARVWGPFMRFKNEVSAKGKRVRRPIGYYVRVVVDGKEKWKALGTKDLHEARRLAVAMGAVLVEEAAAPRVLGFDEAWERYCLARGAAIGASTLVKKAGLWERMVKYMGSVGVSDVGGVSKVVVLGYREWLLGEEELMMSTVNTMFGRLASVWAVLVEHGLVSVNPFFGAALPARLVKAHVVEPVYLTVGEMEKLEGAVVASGDRDLMVAVGCWMCLGMRHGEGVMARMRWFRWPEGEGSGFCRLPAKDGDFMLKDREARVVPLNPRFLRLAGWVRGVRGEEDFLSRPEVVSWSSQYRWEAAEALQKVAVGAGIGKRVTPKVLRHTFASQCIMGGVPLFKVMEWMGHADVSTLRVYAHLAPEDSSLAGLGAFGAR